MFRRSKTPPGASRRELMNSEETKGSERKFSLRGVAAEPLVFSSAAQTLRSSDRRRKNNTEFNKLSMLTQKGGVRNGGNEQPQVLINYVSIHLSQKAIII